VEINDETLQNDSLTHSQLAAGIVHGSIASPDNERAGAIQWLRSERSVVDNDTVSSVRLFYRFASDSDFVDKAMTQIAQSSVYTTSVDIADTEGTQIEYYIQAEDSVGNVVLEGYAFSPNTRTLTTEQPAELAMELTEEQETTGIIVANEPETQNEPDKQLEVKKSSNVLYYVLGALAVGALAAAASGGSSDSGNNPSGDDPNVTCCTVTVEIADPW